MPRLAGGRIQRATRAAWRVGRRYADYRAGRQLLALRLTPPQDEYLQDDRPIVLWRDGNQLGKTTGCLVDLIHRCRGTHPYHRTHRPPINALVLSESWEQMGQAGGFQEKLWNLLPKDEIDPKISFDPGRGITGKPPRVVFTAGPGKGSVITLATFRQGAKRVAGSTVHFVLTDEPVPPELHQELLPRLLRYGGQMRINFTPVLDMPDQRWLRELVDKKQVWEHNHWLKEENCWPMGAPFPWLSQDKIEEMTLALPGPVRRMRIEGAWEPLLEGRWITNFSRDVHIRPDLPPEGATLGIGIDHGLNAGKQVAILFAALNTNSLHPYVWFLDEAKSDGMSTPMQDAIQIRDMLKRNGLIWSDIDIWIGDRPTGESRHLVRKSNEDLARELCAILKIPLSTFPIGRARPLPGRSRRIETPNKKRYSVESGLHLMNACAGYIDRDGTPHMVINPRCEGLIAFCETFGGDRQDPTKDAGDAARYILQRALQQLPGSQHRRRY